MGSKMQVFVHIVFYKQKFLGVIRRLKMSDKRDEPVLAWMDETPALVRDLSRHVTIDMIVRISKADYDHNDQATRVALQIIVDTGDLSPLLNTGTNFRECLSLKSHGTGHLSNGQHSPEHWAEHVVSTFCSMLLTLCPDWNAGDDSKLIECGTGLWCLGLTEKPEALAFLEALEARENRAYPPDQATIALLKLWFLIENTGLKDERAVIEAIFECDGQLREPDTSISSWAIFRSLVGTSVHKLQFIGERFGYWSTRAKTTELSGLLDMVSHELCQR